MYLILFSETKQLCLFARLWVVNEWKFWMLRTSVWPSGSMSPMCSSWRFEDSARVGDNCLGLVIIGLTLWFLNGLYLILIYSKLAFWFNRSLYSSISLCSLLRALCLIFCNFEVMCPISTQEFSFPITSNSSGAFGSDLFHSAKSSLSVLDPNSLNDLPEL